ncbi:MULTISPECIES: hypothetical protein [Streptomyces]|uniref:Uncharacterized protein n=1 Tax=Streptomyces albus TaxID=1888 RepID=A0A8H1L8B4_9ACTN|nr:MULTISPECIES: hypothetical protein [Streptomyces]KPC90728.1 membrane protein [Streptomyces sp. NRRL F-6602]EPD93282.1 hypothetical protein HMPREF1486_03798 [Streptomyces sp. HPH0547]TGG80644.1 hypothetical protein D8771_23060 [Streptomyces albus]UVN54107.1 hypothetical protein NR995_05825 [Streptomyces albus]GHJ25328.1 hypothetical protein TPA0909_69420 [Streptomyces albus]
MTANSSTPPPAPHGPAYRAVQFAARVLSAGGLAVVAYVHATLAGRFDRVTADISQGDLFRIEAGLAALGALLVLVWWRAYCDAYAWLVAAGGMALLLVYQYIDVGRLGPFPGMYDPVWSDDKRLALVAQAVTLIMSTFLLVSHTRRSRRLTTDVWLDPDRTRYGR